jgi:hypothetical protein
VKFRRPSFAARPAALVVTHHAQVVGLWVGFLLASLACRERSQRPRPSIDDYPMEEHAALAASFVSNDSAALRRLLDTQLIVQPPSPDSAQRGAAAIDYLLRLAAGTSVSESRLEPRMTAPEGPFVFEQGIWLLREGNRTLRAPYTLRWRDSPEGWRIVLWRWGAFR